MISQINGKILNKSLTSVTVMTQGGVGYQIFISPTRIDHYEIGKEVEVLTHLIVREDKQDLYGFEIEEEKEMFILALSVSGIGPKSALQLLSLGNVGEIKNAIVSEDVTYISKINGVGKKTAERLILELKNKIDFIATGSTSQSLQGGSIGEVIDALVSMGYKQQQARDAVKDLDKDKTSEELLKDALKQVR